MANNESNNDAVGWMVLILVVVFGGFIFIMEVLVDPKPKTHSSKRSTDSDSSSSSEPSLTGSMDGHAWKSASSGSRQALAADIAKRLNQGEDANISSGFIYSALSSFYSSSDPSVLNTSISEVVGLSVAAAQ